MIVNIISNFFMNLVSCFTKYKSSTNRCSSFEDLETTYLFESDDNDNYR
jgi:hypothetical protein